MASGSTRQASHRRQSAAKRVLVLVQAGEAAKINHAVDGGVRLAHAVSLAN